MFNIITGGLYRTILSADGRSVLPESDPPVLLSGENTLDIVQGPDGTLFDTRYLSNAVYYYKPFIFGSSGTSPIIYSVHPRRGTITGGTVVTIYGINLFTTSTTTTILLGGIDCPIGALSTQATSKKIYCTTPSSTKVTTVNITVTVGKDGTTVPDDKNSATFKNGYRYITGIPQ